MDALSSRLLYSQQDFAKAAAFRLIPAPKVVPKPIINVTWVAQPPNIDGNLNDWNMRAGASLQGAKNRGAQIALTRDAIESVSRLPSHEGPAFLE